MGSIHHLPQHLINKLKAGEIVERPASVVKELLENALDAGSTVLKLWIEEGGKTVIKLQDNGCGMSAEDLPLAVSRYATSKIATEDDLESLNSYGFRGEALAAIAEVSSCRIQTKQSKNSVGYELLKIGNERKLQEIAYGEEYGTTVFVENLFDNTPVRKKYLKSTTTERYHLRSFLLNYLIMHRDKAWLVRHQGRSVWQLSAATSLVERIIDLTQAARQSHLRPFEAQHDILALHGVLGDASLHFSSMEQIRFFVNSRPVEDKIMKKALLEVMRRQMPAGLYPFAYLFLEIDPSLVDVNVHPRKTEVKFLDPGKVFGILTKLLQEQTGEQKVSYAAFTKTPVQSFSTSYGRGSLASSPSFPVELVKQQQQFSYHQAATSLFEDTDLTNTLSITLGDEEAQVVGQLWQSYILAESSTGMYLIDQHALAERIAFERMKHSVATLGFQPELLLTPVIVTLPGKDTTTDQWCSILATIAIDASSFGEAKLIVHSIPKVFVDYQIDIQLLFQQLRGQQEKLFTKEFGSYAPQQLFAVIIEEILGMKACKTSIKAGQVLSVVEMRQLLRDGQSSIPQMFVCQHGRPSILKISKGEIEKMVGR